VIKKTLVMLGALFVMVGCGSLDSEYQLVQNQKSTVQEDVAIPKGSIEYRILPQDRLKVVFYRDPQQSAEV